MKERVRQRIALALKCTPAEVPEDEKELAMALRNKREKLKAQKGVKHG